MCGITGIYAFNLVGRLHLINLAKATQALSSRGPDFQNSFTNDHVGLGHRRLSIIDTSADAHQPMRDETGRYVLIYNGEIYNYKSLRSELETAGFSFHSESDTEVLMNLLIKEGIDSLDRIDGFFSFAFYDSREDNLLIARDRFGIKPLLYLQDQDKIIFASEMKSILEYGVDKEIDADSLLLYLQLNYIPAPFSILKNVRKLEPGSYIRIVKGDVQHRKYYKLPENAVSEGPTPTDYEGRKSKLGDLLEQSVVDRLYADVPLGTFLSGGVDSSVITALAARHTDKLHTFSIGYRDEPYFDETNYAVEVAKHLGTDHTVFKISNRDLYDSVYNILDYIDEPFADSSALAVNVLSRETRKHVTVALSGDGADELFGGYNKHRAHYRLMYPGSLEGMVSSFAWMWKLLPKSRNSSLTDRFRQLDRFASVSKLSSKDRYWSLATFQSMIMAEQLLSMDFQDKLDTQNQIIAREMFTAGISNSNETINHILRSDLKLVLPNDMLMKVDLMSMAHSLEVRVPFLDHRLVEYALSLQDDDKVNAKYGKRILRDTFRDILPPKVFNRPKQGFEVPLLKWFKKDLRSLIWDELLEKEYIMDQGIFDFTAVQNLRRKLNSSNPEDTHATLWALVVFQWWYRKYFSS